MIRIIQKKSIKTAAQQMVQEDTQSLKEPGGSSLHAIKQ
jgi:hypothetical protein